MGNCIYCGQSAGWFSYKHAECEASYQAEQEKFTARRQNGRQEIALRAHAALNGTESLANLPAIVTRLQTEHGLSDNETRSLLVAEWERAVESFLDDGLLIAEEERRLVDFAHGNRLEMNELPQFERVVKSAALTDLFNGHLPKRFNVPDNLPINLQRGEAIVWAWPNTAYLEDKTRRQYVGGSQGISLRIMSGVYYRVGAFKGKSIEHTERVRVDDGWLVVTDQNIYFAGQRKSLRVPYSKIISFEPFNDGIGIMRDAQTAMLQIFVTGDGWFTYNLITNIAKRYGK